jgi:hypothetical protein
MGAAVAASIGLGLVWNLLAVRLMGGRAVDALAPAWLLAGGIAGLAAGLFTVRSRRREGRETLLHGLATYYLGIVVYWLSFVVVQRILLSLRHGGWTDFDLRDHLMLILTLLSYGTVPYGLVLIPLCFATRYVVWRVYLRYAA